MFQDDKFRNYGAAASIQGFSDWVCLGTSKGEARICNLKFPDQVSYFSKECSNFIIDVPMARIGLNYRIIFHSNFPRS